jgi:hypothetical protein
LLLQRCFTVFVELFEAQGAVVQPVETGHGV